MHSPARFFNNFSERANTILINHGNRAATAAISLITLLGSFLRFRHAEHRQFWGDEIHTFEVANKVKTLGELFKVWWEAQYVVDPPLFYLLGFLNVQSASSYSHLRLRLIPIFFGIACIPMAYRLFSIWLGRSYALTAALFIAASPFAIEYSQEYRPYSLLMFATLITAHSLTLVMQQATWKRMGYFMATTVLLFQTHLFGVLAWIPAYFIFAAAVIRQRQYPASARIFRMLMAPVPAGLSYLPMIPFMLNRVTYHSPALNPGAESTTIIKAMINTNYNIIKLWAAAFVSYRDHFPPDLLLYLAAGMLMLGLIFLFRLKRQLFFALLFWAVIGSILSIGFYYVMEYPFEARRNIFQTPFFELLIAIACIGLIDMARLTSMHPGIRLLVGSTGTVILLLVLWCKLFYYYNWDASGWRTESRQADWRGMVNFAARHALRGDRISISGQKGDNWRNLHFRYYIPQVKTRAVFTFPMELSTIQAELAADRPVWYLMTQPEHLPAEIFEFMVQRGQWLQFYGGAIVYLNPHPEVVNGRREQWLVKRYNGKTGVQSNKRTFAGVVQVDGPVKTSITIRPDQQVPLLEIPEGLYKFSWDSSISTVPLALFPLVPTDVKRSGAEFVSIEPKSRMVQFPLHKGRPYLYLMHNGTVRYNFYVPEQGLYDFSITSINDRPGPIRARVWLSQIGELPTLNLDKGDDSIETVHRTARLSRGPQTLTVYYNSFNRIKEKQAKPQDEFNSFSLLNWRLSKIGGK